MNGQVLRYYFSMNMRNKRMLMAFAHQEDLAEGVCIETIFDSNMIFNMVSISKKDSWKFSLVSKSQL